MKSRQLTNNHRDHILSNVVQAVFADETAALKEEEHKLGMELYNHVYSRKELELVAQLPASWFCTRKSLTVKVGEATMQFRTEKCLPVKSEHERSWHTMFYFEATDKFGERLSRFDDKRSNAKSAKKVFENEVKALLHSVRTTKQLLEAWPECA